jgi:hypothetical protein
MDSVRHASAWAASSAAWPAGVGRSAATAMPCGGTLSPVVVMVRFGVAWSISGRVVRFGAKDNREKYTTRDNRAYRV